jgi:aminopeptidase N
VLDYFNSHIGPYSYKKLANVQSKTRWGGLENANTIFYFENSVTGKGERESLIAHEEAHQWFGNSATENDWHHVWLSEGFATYFTKLYLENAYGRDRLVEEQINDRKKVIEYYLKNLAPVIDTTITDINKVLSINTYQKAGWILHMLRREVGDTTFWKGIRQYYYSYRNSNTMTSDFKRVMETASGKDLSIFFNQWLYTGGHPKLNGSWNYNAKEKVVIVEINQVQKGVIFNFPLEIALIDKSGNKEVKTVQIDRQQLKISLNTQSEPVELVLDPGTWLLFEGIIQKK